MQRLKICLTALAIFMIAALPALAASEGESHGGDWSNTLFRVINLAVFLGLCWHFFGKKVTALLKGHSSGIATEISSLEERKAEAAQKLAAVEERIANLDAECKALLAEYTAQGEALKKAIIAKAEEDAKNIASRSETGIENEIKAALEDIRAELAEKIAEATERLIAKKLDAHEHARLIDKYLTKVVVN
ncbi:MAG: ATP synthase F0 subunit B [Desulfovibrio sp.]|jgi:F-type H+-transporting ATPase subunit b|nr:ATP synthase F0 subunit B [Desulfovibrio sp.]